MVEETETDTKTHHSPTDPHAAAVSNENIRQVEPEPAPSDFTFSRPNFEISEIEEEGAVSEYFEISHVMEPIGEEAEGSSFSFDVNGGQDNVYVAVGKDEASVEGLIWALKHAVVDSGTFVYLIHVFAPVRHIPTPLGKLPRSQVSPDQVENFMAQERGKRRELLQKFISICSDYKVKVDTMLIESDTVAKAIQELILVLNIRNLVLGTSKSNSRKSKSRKTGSGITDQISKHAPEYCDVKVISEGKELDMQMIDFSSPRTSRSTSSNNADEPNSFFANRHDQEYPKASGVTCGCFKL